MDIGSILLNIGFVLNFIALAFREILWIRVLLTCGYFLRFITQYMFAEDQGRYVVEIEKENYKQVKEILEKNSVHYDELGVILDKDIVIDDKTKISIEDLILSNNNWLKKYMEA